MADQVWQNTSDHTTPAAAPAPSVWQNTADHAPGGTAPAKSSGDRPWWDKLSDTLEELNNHIEQGMGDAARGAWEMGKRIVTAPEDTRGKIARMIAGPLGPVISDIIQSHIDTANKGSQATQQGRPVAAGLYNGAAAIPVVGPAIASMVETATGTPPRMENGVQVDPGTPAQPGRAVGQLLGNVAIGGITDGASDIFAGGANAGRGVVRAVGPFKSQLNPVEQSAVDFLRSQDVPMTAGTQTGSKFLRANEAVVKHSPLGSQAAADFGKGTTAGIQRVGADLADQINPNPATPESAGRNVSKQLGQNIKDISLDRDVAYQDAWQGRGEPRFNQRVPVRMQKVPELDAAGQPTGRTVDQPVFEDVNMPVDVRLIKMQAAPILDEMDWMPAADQASSAGFRALQKIVKGDDYIPAWQAETGLSGLKDMARVTRKSGVRDTGQGIAASLVGDLQDSIDAAVARTGPDAIRGLQRGRALHASVMDIADLADQLRSEPVQTFKQLTWQHDSGIDFLRRIQQQAPDQMSEIGRAWFQQLLEKGGQEGGFTKTTGLLQQFRNMGPETLKILFPDAELRASLGDFLKGADMVQFNPNTSGTELTRQATSTNPARWAAGYFGSKALFTPKGIRLLTQGLSSPAAAAQVSAQLASMQTGAGVAAGAGAQVEGQKKKLEEIFK